jgi:predicted AAA+ superfamily ATPase
MPAVVVTGARQTGKSTLVQDLAPGPRRFYSMDDLDVLEAARRDPESIVGGEQPVTLDEVQREPSVLLAVKREIDKKRRRGQFLLAGSANLLLMGKVSESLAGRASYLTLWPMTRREQLGLGQCGIWEELVAADESGWQAIIERQDVEKEDWRALALRGGFPTPAVELQTPGERAIWFDGYIRTYLERDLQDLSAIDALPDFRRLMRAACHRLGGMLNQANLGRDVAIPQPTVHRYLNLLEASYLLVRLPAYSVNRTKRLIKSPRLYWGDTGTALNLAESDEPGGEHLENIILNDILAWRDARLERAEVFYWRTQIGEEVDLVIETGGKLLPIEVKATSRPGLDDARHMRTFRSEYKNARSGLLLHTGDKVQWLASDVLAAPWWRVL